MTSTEPDWYGAEPKAPPRSWDFLLTLLFVVLMVVFAGVFVVVALGSGASNGLCTSACDPTLIRLGQLISLYAPGVIALVATVVSVGKLVRRRVAFWVALLGLAAMTGAFFVGRLLIDAGLPAV